ncbi:MAG: shikimate kinase [Bacteroidales bacterium]|nr:shikimate kinase [Bacteroidales bacterium]
MKYFLIGFMGAGKTTLGQRVASFMNISFFDLDIYIENKYKQTISDIFESKGSEYFRQIEHMSLKEIISNYDNFLLSTGGGTPCFYNNLDLMLSVGKVVYLKTKPSEIYKRITANPEKRPFLKNVPPNEWYNWIEKTMKEREFYYSKAHIIIDSSFVSVEKIAYYLTL